MADEPVLVIAGQPVSLAQAGGALLALLIAYFLFFKPSQPAGVADSGEDQGDSEAAEGDPTTKKKKKRKNRKKKKKKKAPEPEPEPESESQSSSSNSESESEEPAPAPAKKGKGKGKKGKGHQQQQQQPKLKGSQKAASKKAAQKQKPNLGLGSKSGYNPTPEDTRKRREREAKRKAKEAAGGSVRKPPAAQKNPETKNAGKITKHGIVGLSRKMTKADREGQWETVGGGAKQKKRAKNQVQMAASQDPSARVVVIPTRKIGMIIGSGGLTLRKIEAETGAQISMPQNAPDAKPTQTTRVTIKCDDDDMLAEAVKCVSDLATKGHSDLIYRGTDSKQSVFKLSPALHHILVGKGGVTIRAIQDKSKCKLVLPTDKSSSKITIIGDPEGVRTVQEALKQIEKYCYCSLADSSLTHREVQVSDTELGYIIGHRGQVIKSIQGDTNTKIYTPGKGRKNKNVIVVGTLANVNRAMIQIQRNIDKNTY